MKIKLILLVILISGVIINLNAQSYPPDGWRVSIPIVEAQYAQKFPEICVKGDKVHTIWVDNRGGTGTYNLYYKKSSDCGFSWTNDIMISLPSEALVNAKRNIGIAGKANSLYVVYTTGISPTEGPYSVCFVRSTDNGATWERHQTIAEDFDDLPEPSIAVSDDSIHLVYSDYYDIVYRASGNEEETWTTDIVDGGSFPDRCPDIVTVNNTPHITFVYNNGEHYIYHAKPSEIQPGWTIIMFFCDYTIFYYPRIDSDNEGNLYIEFEKPKPKDFDCFFSSDGGVSWNGGVFPENGISGSDLVALGAGKFMVTYGNENTPNKSIFGCYGYFTPDLIWGEPFKLADGCDDPTAIHQPHCCIAKGSIAPHLVFHRGSEEIYDLAYIANDDLLLSNTEYATAYNGGRHLVRDPFTSLLHLVYFSQGRPHYSWSNDNGLSWMPYHIIENIHTNPVSKDSGFYPSVGLVPGFFGCNPCLVYIDNENNVEYRYRDMFGEWQGFTILPAGSELEPGPPAVATYDDQVFVVFSVMSWVQQGDFVSAIFFYQFPFDATEPPTPTKLDQANDGRLYDSDVTITIDGNGNPHVAWEKKLNPAEPEDIFYRWRDAGNWDQILDISEQTDAPSIFPHIDDFGDYLSVVWKYYGNYEIYRRRKQILQNQWEIKFYCSEENAICEYPVNASDEFTVWCEKPLDQFDIRDTSDTYGYGWVSQAPENEYFCHAQLQRDYNPWDLYTIFTRGDAIPYRIVCVHQQFGGGGGDSPLYIVETGQDTASVFCFQREAAIAYSNYSVDYAETELIYNLCLLDPTFPFHKIKGTAYFEGNGNKTHEIWVNGEKKIALVVKPYQPYNFEMSIPRELYQTAHRVTVSIKNPQASGVYLSGLRVYRSFDGRAGGGPQSFGDDGLELKNQLIVTPSPFREKTEIRLQIADVRLPITDSRWQLKIYDASGRLVRLWDDPTIRLSDKIVWQGDDYKGRQLSSGIYFIELKLDNQSVTEKVIKLR